MSSKKANIPFSAPLNAKDTDKSTYGCRHTNPDICKNNSIPEICAFVRKDGMCLNPSKAWKKQYEKLKGEQ